MTLEFNNSMYTAAVFLDIEKAFDTTWYTDFLYKLSESQFSTTLMKQIRTITSNRKFWVSVEGEVSTPREIQAGVPQGSVLSPTLCILYINDAAQSPGIHLALFAGDTCMYTTDSKESYFFRKLQRGLTSMQ
jgi:retron-type reverse transcriptase